MNSVEQNELLIASVTPQNLERDVLWFSENLAQIKKARAANPWWRENSIILEKDLAIKPSELLRRITELGYERTQFVRGKGLLAVRGGIFEIWPINKDKPHLIEFTGNKIESLQEREPIAKEAKTLGSRSFTSMERITTGNYVVHIDHGIGIFREKTSEYFVIEYAPASIGRKPDRLYVPLDKKDRLTPYAGFETPQVHRLGGMLWQNTKRKIREDVEKFARELLKLYAQRNTAEREPHTGDAVLEEELRHTFPYQETADQLRAEKEICHDLLQTKPMDRLICGDVGFGKTEIALRAALHIITSGKQAALLVPTTVLGAQHEKTFKERCRNLPIKIGMLSRLTPSSEEKKILQEISDGKIDCVIGTHRLLGKDISFKNLGLVIIDEEQRFGVKQKEHFKEFRKNVDMLSLSATPIPRTLSLALTKLRDISLLNSPPPERRPIQTFVLPYSPKTILHAILFELKSDGQIYFLHNRIDTIGAVAEKLHKSIPNVKIGIIHGRMREKELIEVMDKFRNKEINILLATTIIENGLDISSANTLIVDDATRLGLAQAHQIRGRVGRGAKQAYAYFLYRPQKLTDKSTKRLTALQEYADLGSGYDIAMRDLEIRGAGNILGREQSGAINKVGLNLYCQILAEATEELK